MAKKKANREVDDNLDFVSKSVIKKIGHIIESGDKVLSDLQDLKVISMSPALDIALGGGIREGNCVVMTGDPKAGKSVSALHFASKCQSLNKEVIYLNTEGRITKENFTGIKGLDPSKIKIIQTTEKKPVISAEEYLNTLEMYIKNTPNLVAIVDSVSNMVPSVEQEGDIRTGVRNALPRLLSMFLKRISGDVARNKAIIIFITHNIANTSGNIYAPQKMADCGNMLQYQAGTNMIIQSRGKWESDDSGKHIGQVANWIIKTSASGGIPNSKAQSWIRYGIGIDEVREIAELGIQCSLISKSGSWFKIMPAINNSELDYIRDIVATEGKNPDDPKDVQSTFQMQGGDAVYNMLDKYPKLAQLVFDTLKEVI